MINLGTIGKSVSGWASGFNFYKWGAILVALLAFGFVMNQHGKHSAELVCEQQKTALANARTDAVVKFVNVQAPVVKEQEKKSTETKVKVAIAKEKYDEAVKARPVVPACDLSNDEFVRFNELAKQTTR